MLFLARSLPSSVHVLGSFPVILLFISATRPVFLGNPIGSIYVLKNRITYFTSSPIDAQRL